MKRDLLSFADLTRADVDRLFATAARLKADLRAGKVHRELDQRSLALIFHKPSLRTRLSFEVAMTQLGGASIFITEREIGMGSREAVADVARVLSGYVDGIMIRTFAHDLAQGLARHASVPVINGLTDWLHPCQILADLFTLKERGVDLDRATVAYIGDGNNVANSWIEAARVFKIDVRTACPEGYDPDPKLVSETGSSGPGKVRVMRSAAEAAQDADVLYTDVWASMGQEAEREKRLPLFRSYQINRSILRMAKSGAFVMHCLPAHRGEEITEDVLEGSQSIVFQQAENRMHLQKAILYDLMVGRGSAERRGVRTSAARPKKPAARAASRGPAMKRSGRVPGPAAKRSGSGRRATRTQRAR
jgi:ornithine carbamoyltransferase